MRPIAPLTADSCAASDVSGDTNFDRAFYGLRGVPAKTHEMRNSRELDKAVMDVGPSDRLGRPGTLSNDDLAALGQNSRDSGLVADGQNMGVAQC